MDTLTQDSNIWFVMGGTFVLGLIVSWLFGRVRLKRLTASYENQLNDAQRSLKRRQDDLDSVQSQLGTQRDHAEQLSADKASALSELKLAQENRSSADEQLTALHEALSQESDRREAAESLLEQSRSQAMQLQTAVDASKADLSSIGDRLNREAEARVADEAALKAKASEASTLVLKLEALQTELDFANSERDSLQGRLPEEAPVETPIKLPETEAADADEVATQVSKHTVPEGTQERLVEMTLSVNTLAAIGAELSVELENREQEVRELRAQLSAYHHWGKATSALPEAVDSMDRADRLEDLQAELERVVVEAEAMDAKIAAYLSNADPSLRSRTATEMSAADEALHTDALQRADGEPAEATVRITELEDQLATMTTQYESLVSRAEDLQRERDALLNESDELRAQLDERTKEVDALTTTTLAAAETLQRREKALRDAEARYASNA